MMNIMQRELPPSAQACPMIQSCSDENGKNNFHHLPVQTGENVCTQNTMHRTIEVDDTVHKYPETADYSIASGGISPHVGNCTHHDKMLQKQCMN